MIEVSWKFFPDDIEEAIRPKGAESFYLDHRNFNTDSLLSTYIHSHLLCEQDETQLQAEFIGYEVEEGDMWCYLQFPYDIQQNGEKELRLYITALTEIYPEQQNYVHVYKNDSLIDAQMLTIDKRELLVDFK